jgi:hypothetical protein
MKKLFTLMVVLLMTVTTYAQFSLYGEFRPRVEFDHGNKKLQTEQGEMFNLFTSQRTRLGLKYKQDKFKVGLQIQDVRVWGQTGQLAKTDGMTTTIHQAWAEVMLTDNFSVKAGRMELAYDDQRILGSVNWAQQARSHDLALFKYESGFKLHLGLAVNQVQTRTFNFPKTYKSMQFLWFNKKFSDAYTLSVLVLNNGVDDITLNNPTPSSMTTYSQIIGQRSVFKTGALKVGFNFYYQMGQDKATYKDSDGKNQHVGYAAMNIGLDLNYKLNDNFSIGGGYEFLSGNSQTDTTKDYNQTNHAFAPLYGTNHKFNGWMDYFYVGNHGNSVGLQDIYLKVDYKKNKLIAGAAFHYFMSAADVLDTEELYYGSGDIKALSSGLGMELDTYVGYKHSKGVIFKAGISGMFDSATMRELQTSRDNMGVIQTSPAMGASNYWGWVMLVVKPTFLNGKKAKTPAAK